MKAYIRSYYCLFCFLLMVGFLLSCDKKNKGNWLIENVGKDTVLIAETKIDHPSSLILEISGRTDDSIRIHGILISGGDIREKYKVDWYYPKISIRYDAYKAKKGHLRIRYYLP